MKTIILAVQNGIWMNINNILFSLTPCCIIDANLQMQVMKVK